MLNPEVASQAEIDGRACVLTRAGTEGVALYGPYEPLDPGYYAVEFNLRAVEGQRGDSEDLCAWVDVATEFGTVIVAREDVPLSRLQDGPLTIQIPFHSTVREAFEFRVGATGRVPLLIEEQRRVVRMDRADADYAALLNEARFPEAAAMPDPAFFHEIQPTLRHFYENEATFKVVGDDIIVTMDDVSFYARERDDLNFVEDIFFRNTYNILFQDDCCVIDIGMNIGLVSLLFASKPFVKQVHSFEPFNGTYVRALANLRLNPKFAHKIVASNIGLTDKDEDKVILVPEGMESGSYSSSLSRSGTPHHIVTRNAGTVLEPIIAAAKRNGLAIVAKIDCEGAEYPIFAALEKRELLPEFSAFMVEAHWTGWQETRHDLITALARHGFVVFDLIHKPGKNGLFYAVKASRAADISGSFGSRLMRAARIIRGQVR